MVVADVAGEVNDDGDGWQYPYVVLSVPRRAGKTTLNLGVNLDRLDLTDDARCWYTANTRDTAAKLFRDEWTPMLARFPRTYKLRQSQGSEGVHKRRGSSRLQLFPPTSDALHSTNADTVTLDEAWAFDLDTGADVEAGVRPAQLTRSWRQLWIVSAGGTVESAWWDQWLCVGEAGTPGVALFDFGGDPTDPTYDPASPATWVASHPTAGYGFPLRALAHEYATRKDDASFERAYLNVWPRPSNLEVAGGFDIGAWSTAARPERDYVRPAALALDVSADRSHAALAAAGWHADGGLVAQVIDYRPGVLWLATAVPDARRRWSGIPVVADSLVADSIVTTLARGRVTVDTYGASDHARACSTFLDLLAEGQVTHRSQAVLDDAVACAVRRPLGEAWLWSHSRSTGDVCPLVAVTLAVRAALDTRPAGRPAVVVVSGADAVSPRTTRPAVPTSAGRPGSRPPISRPRVE